MKEMTCDEFDLSLGDYLDRQLSRADTTRFAEHSLCCRGCRGLLDDVKGRLNEEPSEMMSASDLDGVLEMIPREFAPMQCDAFEEMITEFLDGFVPAPAYHRFGAHPTQCSACADLLTDVVLAVAACHSVHSNEEVEVPSTLMERLTSLGPEIIPEWATIRAASEGGNALTRRVRKGVSRVSRRLTRITSRPFQQHYLKSRFVTACALVIATLAILFSAFSKGTGPVSLYARIQSKATSIFSSREAGIQAQKEEVAAKFEQLHSDFHGVFGAIGGFPGSAGKSLHSEDPPQIDPDDKESDTSGNLK